MEKFAFKTFRISCLGQCRRIAAKIEVQASGDPGPELFAREEAPPIIPVREIVWGKLQNTSM